MAGLVTSRASSVGSVPSVICCMSRGASKRSILKSVDAIVFFFFFFLVKVQEVSGIEGFVVLEFVVADFSKFVSVEVRADVVGRAVCPVLRVPVFRCAVDFFRCRPGTVDHFIPQVLVEEIVD